MGPRDATERIPSSGKEELSDSLLVAQRGSVLSLLGFLCRSRRDDASSEVTHGFCRECGIKLCVKQNWHLGQGGAVHKSTFYSVDH